MGFDIKCKASPLGIPRLSMAPAPSGLEALTTPVKLAMAQAETARQSSSSYELAKPDPNILHAKEERAYGRMTRKELKQLIDLHDALEKKMKAIEEGKIPASRDERAKITLLLYGIRHTILSYPH